MNKEANSRAPVELDVRREPPDAGLTLLLMGASAKSGNAGAIRLAAQLAGAEPCDKCGYVWNHCRCKQSVPPNAELRRAADGAK